MSGIKKLNDGKIRIEVDDFGGINAVKPPYSKINLNEFPVMDNYYMDKVNDMLIKRSGFTRLIASPVHTNKPMVSLFDHKLSNGYEYLIAKTDDSVSGKLSYAKIDGIDPAGAAWSDLSTAENSGKVDMLTFKDKLYIANRNEGSSVNRVWGGVSTADIYDMGCPPCNNIGITFPGDTAVTDAGLVAGKTYYYIITFLYDNYQESGAIIDWTGSTLSAVNQYYPFKLATDIAINLANIPVGNARVTARKVYRSKEDDPSVYYELTTITNNTATTFQDVTADDNLGTAINPALLTDLKKPFKSKYQTVHKDYLAQGNLTEDLYNPLTSSDVTVAAGTSGSLSTGNYTVTLYKGWIVNTGGSKCKIILSAPYTVQVSLTGAQDSIDVTPAVNGWYGLIFGKVVSGFTTPVKWINIPWSLGLTVTGATHNIIALSGLIDDWQDLTYSENTTKYNSYVSISDASKPDLFSNLSINADNSIVPNGNVFKIGQDNGDAITGIFSEYNRIIVFKENSRHAIITSAQSKGFWYSVVLDNQLGANARNIIQLSEGRYFFAKTRTERNTILGKSSTKFYLLEGNNEPVEVSVRIKSLLETTALSPPGRVVLVYDMAYDPEKDWIYITMLNGETGKTFMLIFDLKLGQWYVWHNSVTDLDLRALANVKDYGVVTGSARSHVQHISDNSSLNPYADEYIDSGGLATYKAIKTSLQSKVFDFTDNDFNVSQFRLLIQAGKYNSLIPNDDDITMQYIDKIDDNAESSPVNLPVVLAEKSARPKLSLNGYCQRYYFRIENLEMIDHKILGMYLDLSLRHETAGGK